VEQVPLYPRCPTGKGTFSVMLGKLLVFPKHDADTGNE